MDQQIENINRISPLYKNPNVLITSRRFSEVLNDIGLNESQLNGKNVLSVGEGLSDFVLHCNENKLCSAQAIDPVYSIVKKSKNLDEFLSNSEAAKVFPPDRENIIRFHSIKKAVENGTHKPLYSFDKLPFPDGNFDFIMFSTVTSYDDHDNFHKEIFDNFDEVLRVLKPDGYICMGITGYNPKFYPKTIESIRKLQKEKGIRAFIKRKGIYRKLFFSKEKPAKIFSGNEIEEINF